MLKTDLGNSLHNKLDSNSKLYIALDVTIMNENVAGRTTWFDQTKSSMAAKNKLITSPNGKDFKMNDIKKDQTVIRVQFHSLDITQTSVSEIARTIYHELKAHIEMDMGDKKSENQDHIDYGESTREGGVKPKSEAENFLKEISDQ